jgi:hypothetical protein
MTGKRGPKISREALRLIERRALESDKTRTELAEDLQLEFQSHPWPVPQVETLEKKISEARSKTDEQDNLWSLASLPDNPIIPEAIPYVLRTWAYTMTATYESPLTKEAKKVTPLTIREALWIGRIYSIFKTHALGQLGESISKARELEAPLTLSSQQYLTKLNHILTSLPTDLNDVETLWAFAKSLAINEKILNIENYPNTREGILTFWLTDAEVYGLLPEGEPSAGELSTTLSQEFRTAQEKSRQEKETRNERLNTTKGT